MSRILEFIMSASEPTDLPTALQQLADKQNQIAKLREALTEVQQWISNWDPPFIYDDEWSATAKKLEEALKQSA